VGCIVQSIFEKANALRHGCRAPQPTLIKLALKPYQLASVGWMSYIEERNGLECGDGGEWLCSHVIKCLASPSSLLFDVINNRILCDPVSPESRLANFTIRLKGGILAGMYPKACKIMLHFCQACLIFGCLSSCLQLACIQFLSVEL